ncbi:hypothetical protein GCM10007989_00460 [Devosia pacifica]|uniref:Uridine kinase n=1 Tax=Devosia pacifica TaxID=1335967 RepID=A0A918RU90_9HYPH|nr:hypothetical protein [Devosia pacifica]GHA10259.1 hypothetical protein GCM10007989_00460 [Devosia pacifica]
MTARDLKRAISSTEALGACSSARFIAIDGLPVSGKSTFADLIVDSYDAQVILLDDFVRPERQWRGHVRPAFPFPYIRYDEFLEAVSVVQRGGACSYKAYDWRTGEVEPDARTVTSMRPVIVEGVSALHQDLAPFYDVRFWVESDASSVLEASLQRGTAGWEKEWRELFLPSVALYLESDPKGRADYVVRGRGYTDPS